MPVWGKTANISDGVLAACEVTRGPGLRVWRAARVIWSRYSRTGAAGLAGVWRRLEGAARAQARAGREGREGVGEGQGQGCSR